jgi:hypothetical protein
MKQVWSKLIELRQEKLGSMFFMMLLFLIFFGAIVYVMLNSLY